MAHYIDSVEFSRVVRVPLVDVYTKLQQTNAVGQEAARIIHAYEGTLTQDHLLAAAGGTPGCREVDHAQKVREAVALAYEALIGSALPPGDSSVKASHVGVALAGNVLVDKDLKLLQAAVIAVFAAFEISVPDVRIAERQAVARLALVSLFVAVHKRDRNLLAAAEMLLPLCV